MSTHYLSVRLSHLCDKVAKLRYLHEAKKLSETLGKPDCFVLINRLLEA